MMSDIKSKIRTLKDQLNSNENFKMALLIEEYMFLYHPEHRLAVDKTDSRILSPPYPHNSFYNVVGFDLRLTRWGDKVFIRLHLRQKTGWKSYIPWCKKLTVFEAKIVSDDNVEVYRCNSGVWEETITDFLNNRIQEIKTRNHEKKLKQLKNNTKKLDFVKGNENETS